MSDQCWANVGSYGVYVGPLLDHLVGNGVLAEAGKICVKETFFTQVLYNLMQPENTFYNAFNLC